MKSTVTKIEQKHAPDNVNKNSGEQTNESEENENENLENITPVYEKFEHDLNFDYAAKQLYFDDLFFRNSKLINM